jgi:ribosomal protein S12 methylthiotransferase accessory factor
LIPHRPVLRTGCHAVAFRDGLILRWKAKLWQIADGEPSMLASRLIQALDGREASEVLRNFGLREIAKALELLNELSRAELVVDSEEACLWRLPSNVPALPPTARPLLAIAVYSDEPCAATLISNLERAGVGVHHSSLHSPVSLDCGLWIVFALRPLLAAIERMNRLALRAATPCLPALPICGEFQVGPVILAGKSACWNCAKLRRLGMADVIAAEYALFDLLRLGPDKETWPQEAGDALASHVAAAAVTWLRGEAAAGEVRLFDLSAGTLSNHAVRAHPGCTECTARADPGKSRIPYCDDRFGIAGRVEMQLPPQPGGMYSAIARFAIPRPREVLRENWNTSAAMAIGPKSARTIATFEAIERYCAISGGKAATIAPFRAVSRQAVNPESLPLYSEKQYASQDFPFDRFDPDARLSWVVGKSLSTGEQRLVLHDAVYAAPALDNLLTETTSGLAAHRSYQDALASAIMELIERDGFMLHWLYRRMPPVIELSAEELRRFQPLLGEFKNSGYEIVLVSTTSDLGVPVVLAMAHRRDRVGPALLVGAGCSLDPHLACEKALREVVGGLRARRRFDTAASRPLEIDEVLAIRDHAAAYAHPEWLCHAEFLWSSQERLGLQDLHPPALAQTRTQLPWLAKIFQMRGLEAIGVDITTPDLAGNGVRVVRAIVPGLQPIGFGRFGLRLGGSRIETGWRSMGLASVSQWNTVPHCFP